MIPARLESSSFPRKILALLDGKPLIQWVWEVAKKVSFFDRVLFAIDSEETASAIKEVGGECVMTAQHHPNGTQRLIELREKNVIEADIWVNWQADEPFLHEEIILDLLETCDCDGIDVWTVRKQIDSLDEVTSPHVVKVVCDAQSRALYFSRSTIPNYHPDLPDNEKIYYKHCGLYAYSDAALEHIAGMPSSPLEEAEKLEQLRFLVHGLKVHVQLTKHEILGIDLPEHLAAAEERLLQLK